MDLPKVISGEQSAARALWLIGQLGEGSALAAAAAGGPEQRAWTTPTVLLAGAFNALTAGNWQRGGGSGPRPKPVTPPKRKQVAGAKGAAGPARGLASRRLGRRVALRAADAPVPQAPEQGPSPSEVARGGLGVPRDRDD